MGLLDQLLGGVLGQGGRNSSAGGLGDLLGGLAGGGQRQGGSGNLLLSLLPVVLAMLSNRGGASGGGLGGLLQQLQATGLGPQASSWVSTGENMPISADELARGLGHERLAEIATRAGVSEEEASGGLAALLPELVDKLTPQGELPSANQIDDSLASLQRSLGI